MNKINPLYILALVLCVVFISFVQMDTSKKELKKATNDFNAFKIKTQEYKSLKKVWKDKTTQKNISSILRLNSNITYKDFKKKAVLSLNTQDSFAKQKFINKVLNSNLKIEKFNIKDNIIVFEIGKNR